MAREPRRHASTTDPSTWTDYATALAAVQAGHGNGITYILTKDDPFAAIDLDYCRSTVTNSIDPWAQNFLAAGQGCYQEVTPSGTGLRIWGSTNGGELHRKFSAKIGGKLVAAELFCLALVRVVPLH
jgi:primase-polymerase (primpol)-like protein